MKTENKQYGSLYRKYRPKNFAEILGQDHIVEALKRQVATNNLAHAYLFSGTRGTGKTSTALVFAKAINCLHPNQGEPCLQCENCLNPNIDIIEMDAASHNSVDDIREIREFVKFAPAKGKKKIYIVDEVHMLSNAAFNALLKTLEEPPEHIIFILATTELHMIPTTVQSRCQRYDFKRVSREGMKRRILDIAEGYQVEIEQGAIDLIIRMADGSMRDTLALLEQSLSLNKKLLTEDLVANFFGSARLCDIVDIVSLTLQKKPLQLIEMLDGLYNTGVDILDLLSAIIEVLRDLMVSKFAVDHLKNQSNGYEQRVREIARIVDYPSISLLFDRLTDISKFMRYSKNKESILEIALLKSSIDMSQIDTIIEEPRVLRSDKSKKQEFEDSEINQQTRATDFLIDRKSGEENAASQESTESQESAKEEMYQKETSDAQPDFSSFNLEELFGGDEPVFEDDEQLNPEEKKPEEKSEGEDAGAKSEILKNIPGASNDINRTQTLISEDGAENPDEMPTKRYILKNKKEVENRSRTREELDQIWSEILHLVPEQKRSLLKNSKIGIFVGDEMIVNIKGLSKAREMVVEMQLKADVIDAAKTVTGVDCNVKFEAVEKDRVEMEQDAKNVEDYFKDKGISIQIK